MRKGAHSKPMDVKLKQSVMLKLSKLEANKGQIDGLPKNPRIIKDEKFKKLVKSIEENPERTSLREILVYPYNGKYVVIGGNMRLKAMKELGYKEAPCKIIPEETTVEQLKAYTIQDNSGFGEWDFDMLMGDWDFDLLTDCAIEIPNIDGADVNPDDFGENFSLKDGDKEPFQQMTFTLADEQAEIIKDAMNEIKHTEEYKYMETFGNGNTNGNALYLIVQQWADARR